MTPESPVQNHPIITLEDLTPVKNTLKYDKKYLKRTVAPLEVVKCGEPSLKPFLDLTPIKNALKNIGTTYHP